MPLLPENYKFDNSFRTNEVRLIAGTDEAGRGPLAGPVVAAAIIFPPDIYIEDVTDSKVLTHAKREELFPEIISRCLTFSYTILHAPVIDKINILQASLKAMSLSIDKLAQKPDIILIDGNKKFQSDIPALPIVKGDMKSFSIAAASVIAKVIRDRIMVELAAEYPQYGWERNKGYPTKEHREAVKKYGITPYHRTTFLSKILEPDLLDV